MPKKTKKLKKTKTKKVELKPFIVEPTTNFQIIFNTGGQKYKTEAPTIYEALGNVGLDYTQVKTKGTIIVIKDNKKYEHFYYLSQLRKLLASKVRRVGFARQLEQLWANKGTAMSE